MKVARFSEAIEAEVLLKVWDVLHPRAVGERSERWWVWASEASGGVAQRAKRAYRRRPRTQLPKAADCESFYNEQVSIVNFLHFQENQCNDSPSLEPDSADSAARNLEAFLGKEAIQTVMQHLPG